MQGQELPLVFWNCTLLLAGLMALVLFRHRGPWCMPNLVVLITVFTWYPGDILYAGIDNLSHLFTITIIERSLFQVIIFLITYQLMVPGMSRLFLRRAGNVQPEFDVRMDLYGQRAQSSVEAALAFVSVAWLVLFMSAQAYNGFPVLESLFPTVAGERRDMWQRSRLGGPFDFLISAGYYLNIFLCALFGVFAILAQRRAARIWAVVLAVVTWPYFFLGGARNAMLAIGVPTAFAYILFARHRPLIKIIVLVLAFITTNLWFRFVIATRNEGVLEAFIRIREGKDTAQFVQTQRHLGLDMFEELCYVNDLIDRGRYKVTLGMGYFAEAVNIVPRGVWAGKPTIGLEYALARGASRVHGSQHLVDYTVATGLIGQGVADFGGFFGPMAAASLMAVWTGILSRFWSQRRSVMRVSLFLVGLGLTFNAGRGVTLLVFFPFLFGYMLVRLYERHERIKTANAPASPTQPARDNTAVGRRTRP